jgi:hypothetical protein
LALPWQRGADTRSSVLTFGAGVVAGAAIGAFLGLGAFRALAARFFGRVANGQAFVALSPEPEPERTETAGDPDRDLAGRLI